MAAPPPGAIPMPQPGQQPTPQQIQMMQQQLAMEAQRHGMTVPQYIEQLKRQAAMQQQQAQQQGGPPGGPQGQHQHQHPQQQQQMQQQQQQGQPQPINPGPPKPEALAVANFLKSQNLKPRTCIFQEKRKDMFRVKRAIRALQSPAYDKARSKNPLLPEVPKDDRAAAENTFKLLPLSLLALRVSKADPHEGHNHAPQPKNKKRTKGLWTVKVEQQQDAGDDCYYVWLYEGSQWKQKLYAVGALILVFAVVLFPLWPLFMRQGVWYLSMGMLGLIGLFFALAIFRLILFCITVFAVPPGLWLYPNLFEDVGFFDSFKPIWAWHESTEQIKAKKREKRQKKIEKRAAKELVAGGDASAIASTQPKKSKGSKHSAAPSIGLGGGFSSGTAQNQANMPKEAPAAQVSPVEESHGASGMQVNGIDGGVRQRMQAQVEEVDDE